MPTRLAAIIAAVPELAGHVLEASELGGGLSNTSVKVVTREGAYAVRMFVESALLPIDRDAEHANSVLAAESGVGARVVAYLPELAAMVLEFVEGVPQAGADLRRGAKPLAVAQTLRRLHGGRPFVGDLELFAVERAYLLLAAEHGISPPACYRELRERVAAIERALAARPAELRPCHNDATPGNFIEVDGGRLRLIDYEYAANNDPCFDLGCVWVEAGMSLAQLETMVAEYYGEPRAERVARARLWAIVSRYAFALWAAIRLSETSGSEARELEEWAGGRYAWAQQQLRSSELDELLAAVA